MFNLFFRSDIFTSRFRKRHALALVGAVTLLTTGTASADPVAQGGSTLKHNHEHHAGQNGAAHEVNQKRQIAKQQTRALAKALADYRAAGQSDKTQSLNQLLSLAAQRQALMAELVKSDPKGVLSMILTAKEREELPDDAQAFLEEQQELDGELEVFYEDYADHSKSRMRQILKTEHGRIEIHSANNSQSHKMQSGMKVRAKGWRFKSSDNRSESLVLDNEQDSLNILADGTTTTSTTDFTNAEATKTLGEQRTLVMLVNFQDNTQQPWTTEETRELVFGTVNDFYKENSGNQVWLTGDVLGYYTLPISSTCDTWSIHTNAQQAAENEGYDTSAYTRVVYIFPENTSCGWTGKGTVGGEPSKAYINGSLSLRTVGHELGHNFGLHHAKDLDCGADIIGDRCASAEYGDALDIMGMSGITGHFNVFSKEQLGWLSSNTGDIVTVETEGTYQLEPYESNHGSAAKGLKIRRGTDEITGQPTWYYIEYRQPIGFDSFIEGKSGITDGVTFHLATEGNIQSNLLLDMIPDSGLRDLDDSSLLAGSSYTDSEAGVTITTEWANSTGASVHVSFSEQTCTQSNPTVTVSSSSASGGIAGSTVSYNLMVKNNDGNGCPASDFNVSANVPAGWVANDATLSIAPGSSDTVTLSITSSDTAAAGSYSLAIEAISSADNNYRGQVTANYTVEAPVETCVLASPTLALTASQSGDVAPGTTVSYIATLTSQDSELCDAAVVDVIASVPDGWSADSNTVTLAPGGTASVKLNVTSAIDASAGVYPVDVNAFNSADISYRSSAEERYSVAATAPVCESVASRMSISSTSGEVEAGTSVAYNVTVTNQDNSGCTATTFNVFAELSAGWSATNSNVTLNPGQSATVRLNVTSAATASDGTYNVLIKAQNTEQTNLVSSGSASYVIANAVNTSPVAVNDAITLSSKNATLINVLANDSDPEGDTLTIVSVTQGAKGSVQITADGQLRYTPAKSFKSSDTFTYTISDGDKTATATVSVSLSGSESGGGNKGKGKR